MKNSSSELDCARRIVSILLEKTGLTTIMPQPPLVIVGDGKWISFVADRPASSEAVLRLGDTTGQPAFVQHIFSRNSAARSRTTPSLHLTNLDSQECLQGHVDAYYWTRNPLRHAGEFLTKKTLTPSDLLRDLGTDPEFHANKFSR